jgi:hypothetical protein
MTNPRPAAQRRPIAPLAVLTLIAFLTSTTLLGWQDLLWVTGAAAWIVFLRAALKLTLRTAEATARCTQPRRCSCGTATSDRSQPAARTVLLRRPRTN